MWWMDSFVRSNLSDENSFCGRLSLTSVNAPLGQGVEDAGKDNEECDIWSRGGMVCWLAGVRDGSETGQLRWTEHREQACECKDNWDRCNLRISYTSSFAAFSLIDYFLWVVLGLMLLLVGSVFALFVPLLDLTMLIFDHSTASYVWKTVQKQNSWKLRLLKWREEKARQIMLMI